MEPSYAVCGNINWCSHYGKQYGGCSENWKYSCHMIQQSDSWAYTQKKTIIWEDTYTPMFIAMLCTIAKTCKQPKCPSEWIKKMCVCVWVKVSNGILLNHQKEWNKMPFAAARMHLEMIILSKANQKKTNTVWWSLTSGI